jgi:hypothetical protein
MRHPETGEIAYAMKPGTGQHEPLRQALGGVGERGFMDPNEIQYYLDAILEGLLSSGKWKAY